MVELGHKDRAVEMHINRNGVDAFFIDFDQDLEQNSADRSLSRADELADGCLCCLLEVWITELRLAIEFMRQHARTYPYLQQSCFSSPAPRGQAATPNFYGTYKSRSIPAR